METKRKRMQVLALVLVLGCLVAFGLASFTGKLEPSAAPGAYDAHTGRDIQPHYPPKTGGGRPTVVSFGWSVPQCREM